MNAAFELEVNSPQNSPAVAEATSVGIGSW